MTLDVYEEKMLSTWEDVYKRGLLSFWILLSIAEKPQDTAGISKFVDNATNGTLKTEEQSLYRALRRFTKSRMVTFEKVAGNKGPEKKLYSLTDEGGRILATFIERNIDEVFYKPSIQKTIKKKGWL